jgi:pimeloyl-ACP methyl ester carboxylesterase
MLFFLDKGFRVIAHDRRGHGRSTQTDGGHDMDHYAGRAWEFRSRQVGNCFARARR